MSQLQPIRLDTAQPVAAPPIGAPAVAFVTDLIRNPRLFPIVSPFTRSGRALRAELETRVEQGYELLAGRVRLSALKPEEAEPYLQGLDVLERRGVRLLDIVTIRKTLGSRSAWRLSPDVRALRTQPQTPVGRRQRAWLDKLEQAGLLEPLE